MALNKSILSKLKEKTSGEPEIQAFLLDILQFESTPKTGWYEKQYSELLEKHCGEEE